MRKNKLFTLLAGLFLATSMWAQGPWTSGSCTVTLSGSTMTVSGSGAMATNYTAATNQPWKSNRSGVITLDVEDGVTSIGKNCFQSFSDLTTVTIGADVTSIGNTAFKSCSSLTSVTFSATTPATFGTNVFQSTSSSLKLYVPDANAQDYANAWPELYGKIYCATSGEQAPAPHGEGDFGYEGDNLHWDYTDGVLTITGSGDMEDFANKATNAPWINFMSLITTINFPNGLISIGENAFYGATALTAINLPNGLEAIGANAFYNCNNAALTSITFPTSITSIDNEAFYGCTKVTDIYMSGNPDDLYWSDKGCDDFIKSPKKTTRCHVPAAYFAGYVAKNNGGTTGSSATDINVTFVMSSAYTSGDCTVSLISQGTGCETVMTISGSGAMADYANAAAQPWADFTDAVTKLIIEDGVTQIGNHALDGCVQLVAIDAKPTTAPALGEDAFKDFNAGLEVTYPCVGYASYFDVWSIFDGKFGDCYAENICGSGLIWEISGTTLTISKAFPGTGAMTDYTTDQPWNASKTSITSIVVGDGVTTIGNYAFAGCSNVSLTAIAIPEGITTIGKNAFAQTWITELTIPASVVFIGDYACSGCSNLETVNVLATTAPELEASATYGNSEFYGCNKLTTINYPCGSTASYEEVWSTYAEKLHEDCSTPAEPEVDEITANVDPEHPGVYYSTYYCNKTMALPNNGTEAYVATLSGDEMLLTKIAKGAQVLPANTAVILRGPSASFDMTESDETPVTFSATNNLKGSMTVTATENTSVQKYYVLSGHSSDNSVQGVGFYMFDGSIPAQKAYLIIINGTTAGAPMRVRFVFDAATDIENVQGNNVQSTKFIENGMLIIEKNGVRYNAQGQIIK